MLDKLSFLFKKKDKSANAYDTYKITDESFLATWNYEDGQKILKINEAARAGQLTPEEVFRFHEDMEKTIRARWNDKRSGFEFVEPMDVSYKFDKITDYGLSLFCALAVGKSATPVSHMGIGDGSGATFDYQDVLYAEKLRYALGEKGYFDALGRTIRFHVTYDIMEPSYTFTELGLFNNPTPGAGPLVARAVFDPGVSHTSGVNYITANYLISTLSA